MHELTTLYHCNIVYLQHGGDIYCEQNDVIFGPNVFHPLQKWLKYFLNTV